MKKSHYHYPRCISEYLNSHAQENLEKWGNQIFLWFSTICAPHKSVGILLYMRTNKKSSGLQEKKNYIKGSNKLIIQKLKARREEGIIDLNNEEIIDNKQKWKKAYRFTRTMKLICTYIYIYIYILNWAPFPYASTIDKPYTLISQILNQFE